MRSPAQHLTLIGAIGAVALLTFACNPPPPAKKKSGENTAAAADPNAESPSGDPTAEEPAGGEAMNIETGDDSLSSFVEDGKADVAPGVLTPRCATRLSIAIAGKSPTPSLSASKDMNGAVDRLVDSADFAERYARFINARFNASPSMTGASDPVYFLAKHVITNNKPWSDLFIGKYRLTPAGETMTVSADESGIGYFTNEEWMKTYAGAEEKGVMIAAAYRMLTNTTGLVLEGTVGKPGDDRSATGRAAPACRGCHIEKWHALDGAAKLFPVRNGMADMATFTKPTAGPQKVLNTTIASERQLAETLVASDDWRFEQCRNVFRFLMGRVENQCEAAVFDRCTRTLAEKKTISEAVKVVAKDPAMCK